MIFIVGYTTIGKYSDTPIITSLTLEVKFVYSLPKTHISKIFANPKT